MAGWNRRSFLRRLGDLLIAGVLTPLQAVRRWLRVRVATAGSSGSVLLPGAGVPRVGAAISPREGSASAGGPPIVKLVLAGDTMLGRKVGERMLEVPPRSLVSREVVEVFREADLVVLNLECCISTRGEPWPDPRKPFFFRAPPRAVELLAHLGVQCVTLANNHALDFGRVALLDTFEHLESAGIRWAGAGPDVAAARAPVVLESGGFRLKVVGLTDHPRDYAATSDTPGVAFADLRREGVPEWLPPLLDAGGLGAAAGADRADAVLLSPHWGPNMTAEPPAYVRHAAAELRKHVALIAGHSAHVFHGVEENVLYDLGDFLDDYARDPIRRNDLGILVLVTLAGARLARIEAVPLELEFCYTRLARGADAAWVRRRFHEACRALGTEVREEGDRLVIVA